MTRPSSRFTIILLCVLALFLVILGLVSITKTIDSTNASQNAERATKAAQVAIEALRQTSERTECRARVNSDWTSDQWNNLWHSLDGLNTNDDASIDKNIAEGLDRETIQQIVDEVCPAPLSESPPAEGD